MPSITRGAKRAETGKAARTRTSNEVMSNLPASSWMRHLALLFVESPTQSHLVEVWERVRVR